MAELPATLLTPLRNYAGDLYEVPMAFKDSAGDPIDLTGQVLTADWRTNRGSDVVVHLEVVVTNYVGGELTLVISGDASRAMVEGAPADVVPGVWDIQGYNGTSRTTYLKGTMLTTKDVTRG